MSKQLNYPFVYIKTIQFQTIELSISPQFKSIWNMDWTLSGQSGPENDGNGASPSDCLVSYQEESLGKSYLSAERQSIYSTLPADRELFTHTHMHIYVCVCVCV